MAELNNNISGRLEIKTFGILANYIFSLHKLLYNDSIILFNLNKEQVSTVKEEV